MHVVFQVGLGSLILGYSPHFSFLYHLHSVLSGPCCVVWSRVLPLTLTRSPCDIASHREEALRPKGNQDCSYPRIHGPAHARSPPRPSKRGAGAQRHAPPKRLPDPLKGPTVSAQAESWCGAHAHVAQGRATRSMATRSTERSSAPPIEAKRNEEKRGPGKEQTADTTRTHEAHIRCLCDAALSFFSSPIPAWLLVPRRGPNLFVSA